MNSPCPPAIVAPATGRRYQDCDYEALNRAVAPLPGLFRGSPYGVPSSPAAPPPGTNGVTRDDVVEAGKSIRMTVGGVSFHTIAFAGRVRAD